MNDVEVRVQKCFAALFPSVPPDQIPALTQESLDAWDSLATATLLNLVEEEFGLAIDFEELEKFTSFQSVATAVQDKLAA